MINCNLPPHYEFYGFDSREIWLRPWVKKAITLYFHFVLAPPLPSLHRVSTQTWTFTVSLLYDTSLLFKVKTPKQRAGPIQCYHNRILRLWHHPQGAVDGRAVTEALLADTGQQEKDIFKFLPMTSMLVSWEGLNSDLSVSVQNL